MIGLVVAGAGEVDPLGVAKLVAHEVQIALAAETVRDEADDLVQLQAAIDYGRQGRHHRHVRVHL